MTDEERKAFQAKIMGKSKAIIDKVENPIPNKATQLVEQKSFSASDMDNFEESYSVEETIEETPTITEEATIDAISQDQYLAEQTKRQVEDYQPKPKTKEDLLKEVDETAKIYEETDEELRESLTKRGFPPMVVEAMVRNRVPQIDTNLIKEAISGDLTVNQIKEKFGGKLMDEAVGGVKSVNEVKKPTQVNQPKTVVVKPENIIREERKSNQVLPTKSVITEDIRKIIREEVRAANEQTNKTILLQLGDTIRFVVGDDVYEISDIKHLGKKKK